MFSLLIGIGLLLFNATFRTKISQSIILAFNIPVYIAFLFFLPKVPRIGKTSKKFIKKLIVWLVLLSIMLVSMVRSDAIKTTFIIAIAIPIIIGLIELKDCRDIVRIFSVWLKILNIVLFLVTVGGLIDLISGYPVTKFFTEFYHTKSILQMRIDEPNRIISVLGHPLVSSEIGLMGCICNYIDAVSLKTTKHQISKFLISMIVIALCGSKIAFVLALFLMLLLNIENRKLRNIILTVILIYILYSVGMFDVVLERFVNGIKSGDLTTGRNVRFIELYSMGALKFNFFSGHGQELSEHFIIALEYPALRLSYRYGIFYTICLFGTIFVYPLVTVLRRKQLFLFWALLCLIIDVNTFSSLAATGDGMLIYNVMIFLFMNISKFCCRTKRYKAKFKCKGEKMNEDLCIKPKLIYVGRNSESFSNTV